MEKRAKRVLFPLGIGVLAVAAAFSAYFFSRTGESPALRVTGIIDGTEVNLSPKVAGRISGISCREGDRVESGQVVVTLESDDIKASVEQAIAAVERARADIKVAEASVENGEAGIPGAEAEVKSAAADLERATAQMEESKRQAQRRKELFDRNLISMETRDQTATDYRAGLAACESAKERLNAARSRKDVASGQLKAAIGQLNAARAGLKEAEAFLAFNRSKLRDTVIASPLAGTVIFKALETGETVGPGATILTIVDTGSLHARVDVDESKVGRLVLDGPARVTVNGTPAKVFEGRISEIGRYAEFATQRDVVRGKEDLKTFRVKIRVDDPSGVLKPGMTVDVVMAGKT